MITASALQARVVVVINNFFNQTALSVFALNIAIFCFLRHYSHMLTKLDLQRFYVKRATVTFAPCAELMINS